MKIYLSQAVFAIGVVIMFWVMIIPAFQKAFISPRRTEPVQTKTQTKKETAIVVGTLMDVKMIVIFCVDRTKEFKDYLTLREEKNGRMVIAQYFTNATISLEMVGKIIAIEPLDRSALCGK